MHVKYNSIRQYKIRQSFKILIHQIKLLPNIHLIRYGVFFIQVDDKIKIFHQETRLSVDGVAQAISICNLVEQACSLVIPNCKALPYGSLISEFGSYKSDLDICILSECTAEDENFISGGYLNIGGVGYSFCNEKTKSSLSDATADVDLQLLAHTISIHVPGALRVRPIKTAKCPVIKFYYAPANKECDVTINNRQVYSESP